ncbi:endolytic transglycosylase MltG [Bacillus massiliigorillae]|uniref:endolytic transglycosylase MltG n=1 Tax=Bacillus massiliigorillae TaxID=1243664 RepID=UPI0003AA7AB7|nr:endolytic transglycosylase MltG [Bacillus massiliigorillae]
MDEKHSKKEIMMEKLVERQDEAKTVRKIVMITAISIFVLILVVGIGLFFYINSALKPVDPDNKTVKQVEIPIGSGTSTISQILEDHEIIKNARVFKYYIKFKNESDFQAGNYELSQSMTFDEIIKTIQSGKLVHEAKIKILIPEGKQLEEIAKIIADKTNQDEKFVFNELNNKEFIKKMQAKFPELLTADIWGKDIKYPLEGYLYPATYEYTEEKPSVETIVTDMIKKTESVLVKYHDQMQVKKMSTHKLLTMASLIEEEATSQTDRSKISSVFYNRMKVGMPLQTDPTVLYAKGEHKDRVLLKDLKIEDPYNTYVNKGLTPGPIANAGETSIQAALEPANTDYLYFLANKNGDVFYAKTFEEHKKLKAEHITDKK